MAPRSNLKDPHAEILGFVVFADHHSGRHPLGRTAVKQSRFEIAIGFDLHFISLSMKFGAEAGGLGPVSGPAV
jgi:hypothetical protein